MLRASQSRLLERTGIMSSLPANANNRRIKSLYSPDRAKYAANEKPMNRLSTWNKCYQAASVIFRKVFLRYALRLYRLTERCYQTTPQKAGIVQGGSSTKNASRQPAEGWARSVGMQK